jgi:hypothetical protein
VLDTWYRVLAVDGWLVFALNFYARFEGHENADFGGSVPVVK